MTFYVGQDIECVDDSQCFDVPRLGLRAKIRGGQKYKVRWVGINVDSGRLCVRLVGVWRANERYPDYPFGAYRFRPLIEDRKSVSFTAGAPIDSEKWDGRRKVKERI